MIFNLLSKIDLIQPFKRVSAYGVHSKETDANDLDLTIVVCEKSVANVSLKEQ